MPRGDKRKYTDKQKRKAEHIEDGYKARGMSAKEAASRAWATVNAIHGGGEKRGGSGYGKAENKEPMRRGGRKGGKATGGRKRSRTATSTRAKSRKTTRAKSTRAKSTRAKSTRAKSRSRAKPRARKR